MVEASEQCSDPVEDLLIQVRKEWLRIEDLVASYRGNTLSEALEELRASDTQDPDSEKYFVLAWALSGNEQR